MRGKALVVLALAALLTPLAALPAQSTSYCFRVPSTMTALPGVDTIGTAGNDVIMGTAGDDTIYGNGGRDRICGLGGNDVLYGGPGRDRIDGGDGNDIINGGGGQENLLVGGDGNDTIRAKSYGDTAKGGPGNDKLISTAPFLTLYGNSGNDILISEYRNGLDAGRGRDRCTLAIGVPGTGCETVKLLCGSGGDTPPAPGAVGLTSAQADFDGNGIADDLYVWRNGANWVAHIQTDGGFGAQTSWPFDPTVNARALGGYDLNDDGADEAFIVVDAGASSEVVGIYSLWEAVGAPFHSCGLVAVKFSPSAADARFVIDGGLYVQTGMQCRSHNYLREFYQETSDGTHFLQDRYDWDYQPNYAACAPILTSRATANDVPLVRPGDNHAINLAGRFTCGTLSLYP